MNPLQGVYFLIKNYLIIFINIYILVLYEREDDFSDRLNSRASFKGFTALHYAVLTDDLELMKMLLDHGADPLLENELGHRAYEYCTTSETKKLLESYEKIVFK